jgi:mRNA interferase MazF
VKVIERGDVVWASLDPTVGHEQAGHRPYLVLSEQRMHAARGMVICVPMTTRARHTPTQHELAPGSYAICDQPKSIAVDRITRVTRTGYDVSGARAITTTRLIGG